MYNKNKLGIYIYSIGVNYINNISWSVNSICWTRNQLFRVIDKKNYGIGIIKYIE